jgi:hypothetical protein
MHAQVGYGAVIVGSVPRSAATCNLFLMLAGLSFVLVYG